VAYENAITATATGKIIINNIFFFMLMIYFLLYSKPACPLI